MVHKINITDNVRKTYRIPYSSNEAQTEFFCVCFFLQNNGHVIKSLYFLLSSQVAGAVINSHRHLEDKNKTEKNKIVHYSAHLNSLITNSVFCPTLYQSNDSKKWLKKSIQLLFSKNKSFYGNFNEIACFCSFFFVECLVVLF